jgi:hypothetical protein
MARIDVEAVLNLFQHVFYSTNRQSHKPAGAKELYTYLVKNKNRREQSRSRRLDDQVNSDGADQRPLPRRARGGFASPLADALCAAGVSGGADAFSLPVGREDSPLEVVETVKKNWEAGRTV